MVVFPYSCLVKPDIISACSSSRPMDANLRKAALEYHEHGRPGKISVTPTKQLTNQRDLALAYSPGVAAACEEIVADPANVFRYTARGNLVGEITNGTAVLGLGIIGALASKPVMEGKAGLFKKFPGLDVFDIEINETDPDKLVEIIAGLEATFGGINLEDIKAPECFTVERKLRRGQGHRQGQGRDFRCRRCRAGLPGPDGGPGPAAGKHLGDGPGRRGL
ncbi:hypothetical protein G6F65_018034 [Rhizopus arrhizus]|nr:hypothetical protein G6F65_018034 [Rhizopus arrhizus]